MNVVHLPGKCFRQKTNKSITNSLSLITHIKWLHFWFNCYNWFISDPLWPSNIHPNAFLLYKVYLYDFYYWTSVSCWHHKTCAPSFCFPLQPHLLGHAASLMCPGQDLFSFPQLGCGLHFPFPSLSGLVLITQGELTSHLDLSELRSPLTHSNCSF